MTFKQYKKSRGFTIVETMVAISILLIAVVGPMSAIGGSLAQIRIARDQVIAINLAQEGVEVARQRRDSNMLYQWIDAASTGGPYIPNGQRSRYWKNGTYTLKNNKEYIVSSPVMTECSGSSCSETQKDIYQESSTGRYSQFLGTVASGYTKTQFSRKVAVEDSTGSHQEIQVTSTVTWTAQGVVKKIEVKEYLFGISSPQ